jgi:diadenosine tetraphosphatase ApaH/serine/threonine PP2A family protein phosphatase
MRVLVVSDVHANIVALDAVLEDAGPVDQTWSLGDIVGYGPEPNACIARLRDREHVAIAGNHDWGVLGKLDLAEFNNDARHANLWTRDQLAPASREYLEALPEMVAQGEFTLAHGSPRHPIWEYLFYATSAAVSFEHFEGPVCLVGHTHVPVVFELSAETQQCLAQPLLETPLAVGGPNRYIVNPGGVGQPRDGDPRAAYALFDTETRLLAHRRVAYDVEATQAQMRRAGLPARLISRLQFGW